MKIHKLKPKILITLFHIFFHFFTSIINAQNNYVDIGNQYLGKQEYAKAVQNYSKALNSLGQEDVNILSNRGYAYYMLAEHDSAVQDLLKIYDNRHPDTQAMYYLMTIYCNIHHNYQKALEIAPFFFKSIKHFRDTYKNTPYHKYHLEYLKKYVTMSNICYVNTYKINKAIALTEEHLKDLPHDLRYEKARIYFLAGKYDKASTFINQIMKSTETNTRIKQKTIIMKKAIAEKSTKVWIRLIAIGNYNSKNLGVLPRLIVQHDTIRAYLDTLYNQNDKLEVRRLQDKQATHEAIHDMFYKDLYLVGENDMLVYYFSGHGGSNMEESLFFPVDYNPNYPDKAILQTFIRNTLQNSKAKHIIIIMDHCRQTSGGVPTESVNHWERSRIKAQKIMCEMYSASLGQEASYEGLIGGAVFTHYFIKGLKGESLLGGLFMDANQDGIISIGECFEYIKSGVRIFHQGKEVQSPELLPKTVDINFPFLINSKK